MHFHIFTQLHRQPTIGSIDFRTVHTKTAKQTTRERKNPIETIESEIKKNSTNTKCYESGGFIQKSIGLVQPAHIYVTFYICSLANDIFMNGDHTMNVRSLHSRIYPVYGICDCNSLLACLKKHTRSIRNKIGIAHLSYKL